MAKVYVDNRQIEMNGGQNLLHGCLSAGFDLPYFCWHPALGSVGACRQCAVKQFKDEHDQNGRIVMACMTPATENTRISIHDPEAVAFRAAVIEGLMLNHPHDCPVCDEGGECHLQDMTVMTGHAYRRYRFEKRTFRNQYLGPFVNHEFNRCIQCYRCVRFYREYAGGTDLHEFGLRDIVFFGRHEDGVLESEFSGNLVEVCPTGVFTDATLKRHYTRKWDLQMAPSVCAHCGLGCNTTPGERYGTLRRIVNRYNHDVNGYFLCDRGRYGYEFVNGDERVREPLLAGKAIPVEAAREFLRTPANVERMIGIGSPRASLESNFALREVVGAEHFYAGVADGEYRAVSRMIEALARGPARIASLADVEASDAVLVLGEDVPNTAPRMALSLRQSVRQQPMQVVDKLKIPHWLDHSVREAVLGARGPLYLATAGPTRIDDIAARTFHSAPDDLARLGFAVAHALDPGAPAAGGELQALAEEIAKALREAERPLVVCGPSLNNTALIEAAANVARALQAAGKQAAIAFTAPEPNTIGLALMGAKPLGKALEERAGTVVVMENDLYRRAPAAAVDAFLANASHVIVLDHIATRTTAKAELVLPAATFAEGDGTFVNNEGRAQRFFRVFQPAAPIQASWRWLGPPSWTRLDDAIAAMCAAIPALSRARDAAPPADFRIAGEKVPREPHRSSGRTAMHANIDVSEPKPPADPDSALSFSMEGSPVEPPAPLLPFFWSPGWNSIQSVNKFQEEVGGLLRSGPVGVRLFESGAGNGYAGKPPEAFAAREGEWLLVPLYPIFGSEELSSLSRAIRQVATRPHVAMHPEDAARLGVTEGGEVNVEGQRVPVKVDPGLARGCAGITAGMAPFEGLRLPAWSRITRAAQ
jgi:NADH-quinone oxidoreductase subunit G